MSWILEYRVLGPLEVEGDRGLLPLGGLKQRALLALLVLNANRVVSRDRLIDLLWDEPPPSSAVTNLQGFVSQLRKVLPAEVLQTRSSGYLLLADSEQVDLSRFERLLTSAREAHPEQASLTLREALALWRGPPLAEFSQSFARVEAGRLENLRLAALEARVEADLALGRELELVGELEVLIAEQPQHEGLRAQLMLALYRSGRQPEALAAYQEARASLEELGIEPSMRLRELQRNILRQDADLERSERRSNLPSEPTQLVGRGRELAEIVQLVRDNRIVTLTGAGGSGKTRLALRAAHVLRDGFGDGVWFVALASVSDPALVESTIAQAVGSHGELSAFLRGKRLLLVLDNLEQLLPGAATVIARLEATILATSRERLAIRTEQEYPVPPLALEEAVELFTQRARQLVPRFQPDEHVPAIAQRLDGLPLAIELAAPRVKSLSPQQILERLARSLDLLNRGARDAPDRQQTMHATLDWSYRLLDQPEQRLFAAMGVFVGGCTLAAAERVVRAPVDLLQSLVDKNLLRHSSERFWMLETIRAFACERLELLQDTETLRRRHAEYMLEFAQELETMRLDADRFARAKAESSNVRAAVEWALEGGHAEIALALASTEPLDISPRRRAEWLDAALLLDGRVDRKIYANALRVSAGNYLFLGELGRAEEPGRQSLVEFRAIGDRAGESGALHLLGIAATAHGEHGQARKLLERALELTETSDAADRRGAVLHSLGELDTRTGDLDRAVACLEQALQLALDCGDVYEAGAIEHSLGDAALAGGRVDSAEQSYLGALRRARELDYLPTIAYCLAGLASTAAMGGRRERAGRLWGASQAFQRAADITLAEYNRRRYEEILATVADLDFDRAANATRYEQPDTALAAALPDEVCEPRTTGWL